MMEHRSSERIPLTIDLCLNTADSAQISAKSSNLSMGGMLVATDDASLQKYDFVDVSLQYGQGNNIKNCAIRAMVVYRGPGGVGLMFSDMNRVLRKMLKDLMRKPDSPPQMSSSPLKASRIM